MYNLKGQIVKMHEQIINLRHELAVKSARAAKADKKSRQLTAARAEIETANASGAQQPDASGHAFQRAAAWTLDLRAHGELRAPRELCPVSARVPWEGVHGLFFFCHDADRKRLLYCSTRLL